MFWYSVVGSESDKSRVGLIGRITVAPLCCVEISSDTILHICKCLGFVEKNIFREQLKKDVYLPCII
jgi:hypothetical protein